MVGDLMRESFLKHYGAWNENGRDYNIWASAWAECRQREQFHTAQLLEACKRLLAWEDYPLLPTDEIGGATCCFCGADFGYHVETDKWIGQHVDDCAFVYAQAAIDAAKPGESGEGSGEC